MSFYSLKDYMIINYIYNLVWGKEESSEEQVQEPKKIKPIQPAIDYQKIIDNYRKQEKDKQRKDIVDYYKYGHF